VEPQEIKTNLILLSIHYFCEIVNKTCSNKNTLELGMMIHACNLSTWEAEAGGSIVQGQPGLYSENLSQKS
jgi:hypothetical protein